jgi:heat shock protein HtpX
MWLQTRMYLLIAVMFGILYGVLLALGSIMGWGGTIPYVIIAFAIVGLQYLISPSLVGMMMRIRWVTDSEEPGLHKMVAELAERAGLPRPKIGISEVAMPNAFAFGRSQRDGRICVTRGILSILNDAELKAVLGHEMSHIKHRDMAILTLLSAIPMVLYWIAFSTMWGGALGGGRDSKGNNGSYLALIGMLAFLLYFVTSLLVSYGSRIREYYADKGSVDLGNQPHQLASALYRLVATSTNPKKNPEMKRVEALKAFFLNDPAQSWNEVREMSDIDRNRDGRISQDELMELRQKQVKVGFGAKFAEIFMTHPNTLKRIRTLATYTAY